MGISFNKQKGGVPVIVVIILAIVAIIGLCGIGFLLGRGTQGVVLIITFTILGVVLLLNAGSLVKWLKEISREIKK